MKKRVLAIITVFSIISTVSLSFATDPIEPVKKMSLSTIVMTVDKSE